MGIGLMATINGDGNDNSITGTSGTDTVFGGAGNDRLDGAAGADLIYGGAGNDTIYDNDATRDTIFGGDGNDVYVPLTFGSGGSDLVYLDGGNDTAFLGTLTVGQNETIDGGSGSDTFNFSNNPNVAVNVTIGETGTLNFGGTLVKENVYLNFENVTGNAQNNVLIGNSGINTLYGGGGNDSIDGGAGDDLIDGGQGNDTVRGGAGNDVVYGGDGEDKVFGDAGNDTLYGGQGQDLVFGGDGNDVLYGGDTPGNISVDSLYGGAGDDTFIGVGNQDVWDGGSNDDTFIVENTGENFNNIYVTGGEDADGNDIDTLDITQLRAAYPNLEIIYEEGGPGLENGRVLIKTEPGGRELGRITYTGIEEFGGFLNPICFTPGTMIATARGEVAIETLRAGDRVFTRDNGIQEIAWIGSRTLSAAEVLRAPQFAPVLVRAGSLGPNLPAQDLLLSPNHRVLMTSARAALYFEESEVLAAAKHLTRIDGVDKVRAATGVTYIHMMFAQHQVVLSNGAWTESFQPGDYSMNGLGRAQRDEIVALFPELATAPGLATYGAARKLLKKHEAALLTA